MDDAFAQIMAEVETRSRAIEKLGLSWDEVEELEEELELGLVDATEVAERLGVLATVFPELGEAHEDEPTNEEIRAEWNEDSDQIDSLLGELPSQVHYWVRRQAEAQAVRVEPDQIIEEAVRMLLAPRSGGKPPVLDAMVDPSKGYRYMRESVRNHVRRIAWRHEAKLARSLRGSEAWCSGRALPGASLGAQCSCGLVQYLMGAEWRGFGSDAGPVVVGGVPDVVG